jgi:UDP-N-acetylmuramoyl-tripeptide--D-alanyl-D-alanine ligase
MTRPALWTSQDAAAATGGRVTREWIASGVSIDTRTLKPGDLFVALQGYLRDGHDFVAEALNKRAAAALVARVPSGLAEDAPLLLVGDTQKGLEVLGRAARARTKAKVVAVTGSAGKTTTKEMLKLMLSRAGLVSASAASYNNQWGVPLSLARMPRDADFGVFEIGMNHAGEIRVLVREVRPHVALITTIAPAHLEYFGTLDKIADAKAEILEGIGPGGTAILPAHNPMHGRLVARARKLGIAHVLSFGFAAEDDATLIAAEPAGEGQHVTAVVAGERMEFSIGAVGRHIAMNALAALLAVRALGADLERCAAALVQFTALKGRGARILAGAIEIIDESYNANPASMRVALDLLAASAPRTGGRRIAVLGDMLELGREAVALHRALARDIANARADCVFLCGPLMASLWDALPHASRGAYAPNSTELTHALLAFVRAGDIVLIKGSFGSCMSVIVDALKARAAAAA